MSQPPSNTIPMTQLEQVLENELVAQLIGQGYTRVAVTDEASMLANLKAQLEAFNGLSLTAGEFSKVLNHLNRYDVTILVNGLPLVQIELKRRGLEMKEAFNQIQRYQKHSYWSAQGLFHFVQLFVISNGVNTKYYANARKQSFKQTFYWASEDNKTILERGPTRKRVLEKVVDFVETFIRGVAA